MPLSHHLSRVVLTLAAAATLAACAAPPKEVRMRYLWPIPPETPRVEWLGTYASEDDFPKTAAQRTMENITGKPPQTFFRMPSGIASDGKGRVFVSDTVAQDVLVYDFNALTVAPYSGTENKPFERPSGMAVDAAGNLYVADIGRQTVLVFDPNHRLLRTIGSKADFASSPGFVAVDDRRDRVYVSDPRGDKIVFFDRIGKKLGSFGPKLDQDGRERSLHNPQGMALDRDGNLFVALQAAAYIFKLSPEGKVLHVFGERGDQVYQLEAPKSLAFDSEGNLWVADARRPAIYTYTPEGRVLLETGGRDVTGRSPLAYSSPVGIFIDQNDKVYVADRILKRFSIWGYFSQRYLAADPLTPEQLERVKAEAAKQKAAEKAPQ